VNLLVLDVGNSRMTARRLTSPEQWPRHPQPALPLTGAGERETPGADLDPADAAAWFADLVTPATDGVVMVSVVPRLTRFAATILPDVRVVDHRSDLPFASEVEDMAAVGPDRLCNMAAARAAGMADALVVDAGTATTFDVLCDGVFRGGIIAPGMVLAARALAERAARLAPVTFAPAPLAAAGDTAAAMAAGAWHAGMGGVRAIVAGLRRQHGDLPVIVTGGLGGHLADLGLHDPDWTLRGAAWLAHGPDRTST
jgi:pantothenate kinase type III